MRAYASSRGRTGCGGIEEKSGSKGKSESEGKSESKGKSESEGIPPRCVMLVLLVGLDDSDLLLRRMDLDLRGAHGLTGGGVCKSVRRLALEGPGFDECEVIPRESSRRLELSCEPVW